MSVTVCFVNWSARLLVPMGYVCDGVFSNEILGSLYA